MVPYTWLECRTKLSSPPVFKKLHLMLSKVLPSTKSNPTFIFVTTMTEKYIRFLFTFRSLVDMAVIIPYYIFMNNNQFSGPIFISVLRAFEIFHLFPKKREAMENTFMILSLTVYKSITSLLLLAVIAISLIIFLGTIMYELEMGTFVVSSKHPNGYYQIFQFGVGG